MQPEIVVLGENRIWTLVSEFEQYGTIKIPCDLPSKKKRSLVIHSAMGPEQPFTFVRVESCVAMWNVCLCFRATRGAVSV